MTALNGIYLNQHSTELRGNYFFFFPSIHFLLPCPTILLTYFLQFKEVTSILPTTPNHFSPGIFTYHSGSLPGYPVGCPSIGGILKLLFDNSFDL